jgi:hypothetical protein
MNTTFRSFLEYKTSARIATISLLACLAIGLGLDFRSGEQSINSLYRALAVLVYTLGAAHFVSVAFIKRIEDSRHEDQLEVIETLRQKIQQDVLAATMGKFVPSAIFAVVKRDVLERGFIAKRGRWEIIFDVLPDNTIRSKTFITYQIINTREVEHHETRKSLVGPTEAGKVLSLLVTVEGKEVINTDKKTGDFRILSENDTSKISHSYTIPPNGRAESISVYEEFYTGFVSDSIYTFYPTEELDILIRFPEGFDFSLVSYSSSEIECYHSTETSRHYRYGALLPGQGLCYTLRRSPTSGLRHQEITNTAVRSKGAEVTLCE